MRSLSKKLRYRHTALCLRWRMIKRIPEGVIYLRRLDSNGSNHGYTSGAGRYFLSVTNGTYYLGFSFIPEQKYTITIQ